MLKLKHFWTNFFNHSIFEIILHLKWRNMLKILWIIKNSIILHLKLKNTLKSSHSIFSLKNPQLGYKIKQIWSFKCTTPLRFNNLKLNSKNSLKNPQSIFYSKNVSPSNLSTGWHAQAQYQIFNEVIAIQFVIGWARVQRYVMMTYCSAIITLSSTIP